MNVNACVKGTIDGQWDLVQVVLHMPACVCVENPGSNHLLCPRALHASSSSWNIGSRLIALNARLQGQCGCDMAKSLENHGTPTMARKGFPIACDYSGTAHSFMGATLQACTLDLGARTVQAESRSLVATCACLRSNAVKTCASPNPLPLPCSAMGSWSGPALCWITSCRKKHGGQPPTRHHLAK